MSFKHELELARTWRERQGTDCERSIGYVVIFNGQVAGWKRELDNPQGWEPGCLAVSPSGSVYQAEGGNAYDGAQVWQRLDLPNPALKSKDAPTLEQLSESIDHLYRHVNNLQAQLLKSNDYWMQLHAHVHGLKL